MATKERYVSDITGLDIKDRVRVRISQEGHHIRIGKDHFVGDTVLDVDVSELSTLMSSVQFVPDIDPQVKTLCSSSVVPKVTFFSLDEQLPTEAIKVPVVKPQLTTDCPDMEERP